MEGSPFFPESSQEDDDDSESTLAKKRDKRFELKDTDDKPKRISLENLFVREEVKDSDDKTDGIQELFNRKDEGESELDVESTTDETDAEDRLEASAEEINDAPEVLVEEEVRYTAEVIAQERTGQLQAELEAAEPGSEQEAEALAGAAFVENLLDKAKSDENFDETSLEEAYIEAAADIGADANTAEEEDTTEPVNPVSSSHSGSVPVSSSGSGGSVPPPNVPPMPSGGMAPPPGGHGSTPSGPWQPTGAIGAPMPQVETVAPQEDSHSHLKYVVAGGIVGYLMGRRRGRIKTEQKLMPIQQNLESQVQSLTSQIAQGETRIRSLARKQHENGSFSATQVVDRLNEKSERRHEDDHHATPLTPEHTVLAAVPNKSKEYSVQTPEKSADTMLLAELLQVASAIELDGQSVKTMFESGKLDAPALRRIVKEYMHNGDYKRELMRSLQPERLATPEAIERESRHEKQDLQREIERSESQNNNRQGHIQAYPDITGKDDTPPIGFNKTTPVDEAVKSNNDTKRTVLIGAASVIAVIVLALIVGSLLRSLL